MTDDPNTPTPEQKAEAAAVLADPDYIPEPDDTSTIDDPVEGEDQ